MRDDKEIERFRNHIISDIRLEENYLGEVDTVAREFKLKGDLNQPKHIICVGMVFVASVCR